MEKNDVDKVDDEMLPGFRFHPTDEELVGFYLVRKIQQRPLPIELIKQVDIYQYDPWDLPKLASNGEKELYFYCPRDRKYRNSARPNRVTAAGFWKATGTDRPIYSSDGKCIGLKKSLVFYRGRAAKGFKTDWMMHEFRLPPLSDLASPKKVSNKSFPANDAWAICRIFKKTSAMAQRAFSHSWMAALPEAIVSADTITHSGNCQQFSSENISCTTEIGTVLQFCVNSDLQQASSADFSGADISPYKPISPTISKPSQFPASNGDFSNSMGFPEVSEPNKSTMDGSSILFNPVLMDFDGSNQQFNRFSDMQNHMNNKEREENGSRKSSAQVQASDQWGADKHNRFPFSLSPGDAWKPLTWDSTTCPNEMSSGYSTNKCCN